MSKWIVTVNNTNFSHSWHSDEGNSSENHSCSCSGLLYLVIGVIR